MTVAAIDRLVHHAIILEMNTASYRRKTAQARVTDFTTNETVQLHLPIDAARQLADQAVPAGAHPN